MTSDIYKNIYLKNSVTGRPTYIHFIRAINEIDADFSLSDEHGRFFLVLVLRSSYSSSCYYYH
jgi:hypothetical protein